MPISVRRNHNIQEQHSFHFPVVVDLFLTIEKHQQLFEIEHYINQYQNFVFLGLGNNVVFTRNNHTGCVLHMAIRGKKIIHETDSDIFIQVGGGEDWPSFVRWTLDHHYPGLENLTLIPGTVGAAPVHNIGAYGVEIKSFLHEVIAFDCDQLNFCRLRAEDMGLTYRWSLFKTKKLQKHIITDVVFRLPKNWHPVLNYEEVKERLGSTHPSPEDIERTISQIRREKIPCLGEERYHAGSFFRNPELSEQELDELKKKYPLIPVFPGRKTSAGWLIEQCGWKGKRQGNVGVSKKHALILTHNGQGNATELVTLYKSIQDDVYTKTGIHLEPEVVLHGF